jgi:hypothetical protein
MLGKVLVLVGFLVVLATVLFADNVVKLSTYYPAPFGAYDRIKLVPRESLPLDPNCDGLNDLGTMYYDQGSGPLSEGVYVCQRVGEEQFAWVPVSGKYY